MFPGPLVSVVVSLIVVGLLMWLVNSYIPMDARIKQILNIVVIIAVVLWLLSVFGVFSGLPLVRVGNP
ncbi:MAG: Thivi_2564 family membrane protein [Gammaproteobacteria bacterium]